ncbi:hypothetical protein M9458_025093, partial [Cirrhinus mrigala]
VKDLKEALRGTDPNIPLVFVSGNHDLGNTPTPETVEQFCRDWGDDYFSFWVGGVLCLVLNSQFFFDSSGCPELMEAHESHPDPLPPRACLPAHSALPPYTRRRGRLLQPAEGNQRALDPEIQTS